MRDAPRFPLPLLLAILIGAPALVRADAAADLKKLCDDYWQGFLKASPNYATELGDHRYDALLDNNSPAGTAADRRRLEAVRARANAIPEAGLSDEDRLTRSALLLEVRNQLDQIDCHFEDWVVDPLNGPQVSFMNLPDVTVIRNPKDAENYVKRLRAMGGYLDQHIANLRSGLKAGRVAASDQVRRVVEELDALAARPPEQWPLDLVLETPHPDWKPKDREVFEQGVHDAVRDVVKPGFLRLRNFLDTEVRAKARPQEKAGLSFLPGGRECYLKRIRIETSLDRTPEELHQLGLDEVARFRRDLSELGGKALGTTDVATIQKKLRTDPATHFASADEVEAKARATLDRARAAIPNWFGILPKAGCEVKVMGMHEAPNSTIAYYRPCAPDGSRPGYYMINTYQPTTRPKYEAEALAFHESIPGHHLQIAIAQELKGMPEFRKHLGVTAFVEGWGLYSERLADDMGLYSTDVDRIGMLSYDAWRASRLVVDTGLHAMGWSRQQAIDYMVENTVLAENNIANEVDRYLSDPGQALAYKCGQLEILKLRDEAKQKLGSRFDIKSFHDVVLSHGAVALPVLRQEVEGWIAKQGPNP